MLVLAGYRAQKEDELSLAPGDVIRQVRKGPARGWMRGELGGRCGLFPESLVQVRSSRWSGGGSLRAPEVAPLPVRSFAGDPGDSLLLGGDAKTALCAPPR